MKEFKKTKVLVVEDDAIVAQDIADILVELGHEPVGPVHDIEAAKQVCKQHEIHLALLDINLEGPEDGILLSRWINEYYFVPIVFLTAYSDPNTLSKVKSVSPHFILVKPFSKNQLLASLEITVNNFHNPHPIHKARGKIHRLNLSIGNLLTSRETEVLLLVYQGDSNQQIADRLFVSINTIKSHMKNIFIKTGSTNRTELICKLHSC